MLPIHIVHPNSGGNWAKVDICQSLKAEVVEHGGGYASGSGSFFLSEHPASNRPARRVRQWLQEDQGRVYGGAALFRGMFLLQNLLAFYSYVAMFMYYASDVEMLVMGITVAQTAGLAVLLWLSLR